MNISDRVTLSLNAKENVDNVLITLKHNNNNNNNTQMDNNKNNNILTKIKNNSTKQAIDDSFK